MYCKECGNELKSDATFCNQCGAKILSGSSESESAKAEQTPVENGIEINSDTQSAKNGKIKTIIHIIGGILFIILMISFCGRIKDVWDTSGGELFFLYLTNSLIYASCITYIVCAILDTIYYVVRKRYRSMVGKIIGIGTFASMIPSVQNSFYDGEKELFVLIFFIAFVILVHVIFAILDGGEAKKNKGK